MWPFTKSIGKVQNDTPPPGINDFASYTSQPGSNGTEAARFDNGSAPQVGTGYFPTIANQDAALVHWMRPPGDENPDEWYADQSLWQDEQAKLEKTDPLPMNIGSGKPSGPAPDPRWVPPTVSRVTNFMAPNGYSMTRPFDQTTEHENNGYHFSMADVNYGYEVGEMTTPPSWRNTYRLDAPTNDATSVTVGAPPDLATSVRLASENDVWPGRNYRLGG
jgi:hypothetical protein